MKFKFSIIELLLATLICTIIFAAPVANAFDSKGEILVNAGTKARDNCPVTVVVTKDSPLYEVVKSCQPLRAISEKQSASIAVLPIKDGIELAFVVDGMKAWETRTYRIEVGTTFNANPVEFKEKSGAIDISIAGKPFSTYDYTVAENKKMWPNFYPLLGLGGAPMTRNFPMKKVEGESEDHPHHQSLWVSHGDVNGVNFWNFSAEHGFTKQQEYITSVAPAAGRISAVLDWVDHEGKKIFEEERILTIWGTPDCARMIDFDLTFKATEGDVKFGDTKEGGLVSLRVASTMREKLLNKEKGGTILNSKGGVGAGECWGKPAPWCDYSGLVDGNTVGMTIMDYPTNPFYPMRYHVRDYGLFTANPFGLSHFIDKSKDGSQTLEKGKTWKMKYRVYIHAGDAEKGKVAEAFANFTNAPTVTLK